METWVLKCSDGEQYSFKTVNAPNDFSYDARYHLLRGAYGHHGMPVKYTSDPIPNIAGEELRDEIRPIRELYMPIRIQGINPSDLSLKKQQLRRSLAPVNNVELWITNEMGDTRVCYCRYLEGFDKAVDDEKRTPVSINIPLKLVAYDPWFYDIPGAEVKHIISYAASVRLYFDTDPWFSSDSDMAWRLGGDSVNKQWTVFNEGEAPSYPIWIISGPGKVPTLQNFTSGKQFLLNYELSIGETVTIDMNAHTIESSMLGNIRKYLDPIQRDWWPMVVGPNDVKVELNFGDVEAGISLSFLPMYEGV
jgi:hypothetical protein